MNEIEKLENEGWEITRGDTFIEAAKLAIDKINILYPQGSFFFMETGIDKKGFVKRIIEGYLKIGMSIDNSPDGENYKVQGISIVTEIPEGFNQFNEKVSYLEKQGFEIWINGTLSGRKDTKAVYLFRKFPKIDT